MVILKVTLVTNFAGMYVSLLSAVLCDKGTVPTTRIPTDRVEGPPIDEH